MASIEMFAPDMFIESGASQEDARPVFGGPIHGTMRAVPAGRDVFYVERRFNADPLLQAGNPNALYVEPSLIDRYMYRKEYFGKVVSDLLRTRIFVWLCDGWSLSRDDLQRVYWELDHAKPELIPEPNILTEFDLWFRWAAFRLKFTERIVQKAYGKYGRCP